MATALPTEDHLWQMLAFAGRYGHQDIFQLLEMSSRDFARLNHAIADLVRGEGSSSIDEARATGGG